MNRRFAFRSILGISALTIGIPTALLGCDEKKAESTTTAASASASAVADPTPKTTVAPTVTASAAAAATTTAVVPAAAAGDAGAAKIDAKDGGKVDPTAAKKVEPAKK